MRPPWPGGPPQEAQEDSIWADETLRPIRDLSAEVDVVPVVMARIRAGQAAVAAAAPHPTHRSLWTLSLAAGIGMLAIAATALAALFIGGDVDARQLLAGAGDLGRAALIIGQAVLSLIVDLFGALLLMLTALGSTVRQVAPLVRGAGTVAATVGVLSILLSFYVFASARRLPPAAGVEGGVR